MGELTIGEVARRAGINISAIRYYESVGLLSPTRRVHGHRRYTLDIIERLAFIRTAQQVGFDLGQIHDLVRAFETRDSPVALCQEMARQKLMEVDRLLSRLKNIRRTLAESLNCNCASLTECAYTLNMTKEIPKLG
ncbi:MAG: MerR family transcriptional regulator [Acidobacteriota bacterium]|nr:MerR family transcriptional regulator [Acidobacteriota bacterium]